DYYCAMLHSSASALF
nr:immunoglobulin light chain junction region [Macaca mulatta]